MKLTHLAGTLLLLSTLLPLGSAPAQTAPAQALPDTPSFTRPVLTLRPPAHADGPFEGENGLVHNSPAFAQKPARNLDWRFLAAHGVYASALAFDLMLTKQGVSHGCEEASQALGPYPGTGRIVGYGLGEFAAVMTLDYLLKRTHVTGLSYIGAGIGTFKHVRGGMAWTRTNCL